MKGLAKLFLCSIPLFHVIATVCDAVDTIAANQTIIRDDETIVSAGGNFELGIFKPSNSSENRFLGIWYKKISSGNDAVVWVANRATPLTDASAILRINAEGILQLINSSSSIIWSSNTSRSVSRPVAQLLDTGNLIVRDETASISPENFIWQSFDYPGDTMLSGMKLFKNLVTGRESTESSWKSAEDPSPGEYTIYFDLNGYPQIYERKGTVILYRLGGWNGVSFTGMPSWKPNPFYTFQFAFNQEEISLAWDVKNSSVITKTRVLPNGDATRYNWNERTHDWFMYSTTTTDACTRYALCGPYGSCNIDDSPACRCLDGFQPRNAQQWDGADWSSGCTRKVSLDCASSEGFQKYSHVKLPDTRQSWFDQSMTLEECKIMCKNNCSCTAYSNLDIRGSGCLLWFGDLIDIRKFADDGDDIYVRLAASELEKNSRSSLKIWAICIPIVVVILITGAGLGVWHVTHAFKRRKLTRLGNLRGDIDDESHHKSMEPPLLSLSEIHKATNNFSIDHKLGEGGFGPVYKGKLSMGQEIAVKRLSKNSQQGLQEFKNEIVLISKLQHRNLVKIVGCCLEGDERMLAYEYLPNKSLDNFIFDEEKRLLLTWQHRVAIAIGIAKGLLYLHDDSRLRIIHRDLKASNILLDSELNPKISDFGIARIFGGDQGEGRTKHVIGTYGYMSPEYTIHGKFSVKSDVFSFGVLLLELVSGKKNAKYHNPDHHHSLLGHAWMLWKEGKAMELIDACLENSFVESQVLRFIGVGLLCTQKQPKDRPTMSSVLLMLNNEGATLPQPKEPGFYMESNCVETNESFSGGSSQSVSAVTITMLEVR